MDSSKLIPAHEYILNLSWNRPRDMVRFIKTYQKTNGSVERLLSGDNTRFLKEYSRISSTECLAELSVKYGESLVKEIRRRLNRRYYDNYDVLCGTLDILSNRTDIPEVVGDLFQAGVILNYDTSKGFPVFYASYRDDAELDPHLTVMVHRALWSSFHLMD